MKKNEKMLYIITERKVLKMTHYYELRSLKDDGTKKTVLKITAEPKYAKQRAKEYAKKNPNLYLLEKVEKVAMYFTKKE